MHLHHNFFIDSSTDEYLGCFHVLAIINNAAMNVGVQMSFWISVFISLDILPEVEFLDYIFNFLRIFHIGYTNLKSY